MLTCYFNEQTIKLAFFLIESYLMHILIQYIHQACMLVVLYGVYRFFFLIRVACVYAVACAHRFIHIKGVSECDQTNGQSSPT